MTTHKDATVEQWEHQELIEKTFNKNQTYSRIRAEFEDAGEELKQHMIDNGIEPDFGYDLLVQMALHKRADVATLVGALRHHFAEAQDVLNMAIKCAEADLVEFVVDFNQFVVTLDISEDVQEELDRFQYPLPCIIQPRTVNSNTDNGYHFVRKGSLILKQNHHNDDICLDHINRVNAVRFRLDHDTAKMMKNQWSNLDKPKEGEEKEDFEKRVRAFEKYDRTAKDVMDFIQELGDEFYLTHKYDKRGRIYCQGYHVSYQGAPWNKAVIEFAEGEIPT
ncbi:RNA polymerase, phage-associated [Burkholderia phage vB_BpP_HN05]